MPFDFASISAPFRMQPGLRRIAAGAPQLTANRLGDDVLAAKLDVLRAFPDQALCANGPWDDRAIVEALCGQAQRDCPGALLLDADGGVHALWLGHAIHGGEVHGEGPAQIGDCLRALPPAWRRIGLLCLALAEDFALIEAATATIPWLAVCLPSHWAPEDKVGRHFAEVHGPVADNALVVKAGESLARLVSGPDRWERFVWTITPRSTLDAHPRRQPDVAWSLQATSDELAAAAWFRTEHQTFLPLPGKDAALFTIHVEVRRLEDLVAQENGTSACASLHAALATMSPAVLAYRGLTPARDRLLQWLEAHGGHAPVKTAAITPARVGFDETGVPFSQDHSELWHPDAADFAQAKHIFLAGSGLPERWQGRDRFVVLETGFGIGNNFLATWAAWRADPARCRQLFFMSIEHHPLRLHDLQRLHRTSPAPELAAQLLAAWPPLTPNLHTLSFEDGQVQLLLALGDVAAWLPELVAEVDVFFLGGFAPSTNPVMGPMGQLSQPRLFKALGRMAAHGATVATWADAPAVRQGLTSAGFEVREAAAIGGQRGITLARFAPAFMPKRPAVRRPPTPAAERHALVLGAGLAGCATVAALAEQAWEVTLVDRHAAPAQEASGNAGGLFHGVVHGHDGHHARFNRACALVATREISRLLADAALDKASGDGSMTSLGEVRGALRLETSLPDAQAMRAVLQRLGLLPDHVQALDAREASLKAGLPLNDPAWFYPGGGWVRPALLAQAWLTAAGAACRFIGNASVDRLLHDGRDWHLIDARGALIARAPVLVLANAADAPRLLDGLRGGLGNEDTWQWPVHSVRGQLSLLPHAARQGMPMPKVPVAGAGYLLPAIDGCALFGATAQPGDDEPAMRAADHRHNLDRLARLSPAMADLVATLTSASLQGRVAWRSVSDDRLPLVGAVLRAWVGGEDGAWDQPRFVSRQPGLFMFTALGSRGITWSPLCARVLASAITGAPSPLEADLLDAIDPARFMTRAVRRRAAEAAGVRETSAAAGRPDEV